VKIKKISKLQLKRIIKEELQNVLAEDEYGRTSFVPADQSTETPSQKCERLVTQKIKEIDSKYSSTIVRDKAQRYRLMRRTAVEILRDDGSIDCTNWLMEQE
jgi:hypothetical protein